MKIIIIGSAHPLRGGLATFNARMAEVLQQQGHPAVCTAVGGVPEVTGGAAWLVPGSDQHLADRLADAVAALLDQPVLRTQWAARGRCHAAAWPDAATVASRHAAIYQTLV